MGTSLGVSTTINSLNVNGVAASNTIYADGSILTIMALADTNTDTGGGFNGNAAGSGIAIAAGAGALTINVPIVLGNSQTWTNGSSSAFTLTASVSGSAPVGNTQTLTLSNTGSGGTTLSGIISDGSLGAGRLAVKVNNSGSGMTVLSGSNTYTGGTTVSNGTLQVGGPAALGPMNGSLTANGGVLDLNGFNYTFGTLSGANGTVLNNASGFTSIVTVYTAGASSSFGGSLSDGQGVLALTKSGANTLYLTGVSAYSGGTVIAGGTLNVNSDAALGNPTGGVVFNNTTLQMSAGGFNSNRPYTLTGAGTFDTNGFSATISSNFNGNASFTKVGSGTLTLGGNGSTASNVYYDFGTTIIQAGASVVTPSTQSVAQLTGDYGTLNVAGALSDAIDFNVGDNTGSTGILNVLPGRGY